jgi:sugar phosphate permease
MIPRSTYWDIVCSMWGCMLATLSAQIATAFNKTGTPWNLAFRAIGIVGAVVGVFLRLVLREPPRRTVITLDDSSGQMTAHQQRYSRLGSAKTQFLASLSYILRMRSF